TTLDKIVASGLMPNILGYRFNNQAHYSRIESIVNGYITGGIIKQDAISVFTHSAAQSSMWHKFFPEAFIDENCDETVIDDILTSGGRKVMLFDNCGLKTGINTQVYNAIRNKILSQKHKDVLIIMLSNELT